MFRRLEPFSARHQRWSFLLLAINMLKKILLDTFRQLFEAPRKVANAMLMPTMCWYRFHDWQKLFAFRAFDFEKVSRQAAASTGEIVCFGVQSGNDFYAICIPVVNSMSCRTIFAVSLCLNEHMIAIGTFQCNFVVEKSRQFRWLDFQIKIELLLINFLTKISRHEESHSIVKTFFLFLRGRGFQAENLGNWVRCEADAK